MMKTLINCRSCRVMKFLRFHRRFSSQKDGVNGKVALVTGAAQGLGKAVSEILLKNGAKVCLADYNSTGGIEALTQLRENYGKDNVMFKRCDVTKLTQMKETFEVTKHKLGGIDIVINNAGTVGEMGDMWETTVDINLNGTIRGTLLGMHHMRKDKGGRGGMILNVASMAGINPSPVGPVYSATKSGVIMFSECWSKNPELLENGVRINILAPAVMDTSLLKALSDPSISYIPDMAPGIIDRIGVMTPEEVAKEVLELLCDKNKNGATVKVAKV